MDQKNYFNITDHLSDTRLEVVADTLEKMFEVAANGMFSLISDIKKIKETVKKDIDIIKERSFGIEDMLIFWLEELIYHFEVDSILFSRFKVKEVSACDHRNRISEVIRPDTFSRIRACAYGEYIDLLKHEIFIAIKSPTYHNLSITKDESSGLWKASVVFDV